MNLWKAKQEQAAERERQYARSQVRELESILGVPQSDTSNWSIGRLFSRRSNLRAQTAITIREELKTL